MLPKIILHNSVSLDSSLTNFDPNMELHYQIAGKYNAEARLIGSNTVKVGIELYGGKVPPEEKSDFNRIEIPDQGISLEKFERDIILSAIDKANGNLSKAARLLKISRGKLRYRLERLDIYQDKILEFKKAYAKTAR